MGQKTFSLIFLVDRIKDYNSRKSQPNCMIFKDLSEKDTREALGKFFYTFIMMSSKKSAGT